jgi:hypothetical protein
MLLGHPMLEGGSAPAKLSDEHATAEMQAFGVDPPEPYPGLNAKWTCKRADAAGLSSPT